MSSRNVAHAAATLLIAGALACSATGISDLATNPAFVDVQPRYQEVGPGDVIHYRAAVYGTLDTRVKWDVVETGGGLIDPTGLYTAPDTGSGPFTIRATTYTTPAIEGRATVRVIRPPTGCAAAPLRAGPVYYYCDCRTGDTTCQPGNDTNAGTSADAPRRSLGNAVTRFGSMANGATIALCRGGVWTSGTFGYLPAKTCGTTDDTACDIRDYVPSWGSLSTPKPLVDLGTGGHAVSFVNNTSGIRMWNIEFRSTTSNHDAGDGMIGVYDSASGLDLCNVTVDGGKVGMNIQSSGTIQSYLRQSTVTNIGQTGIYHAASNWTFDSNLFKNNQQAISQGNCSGYCGNYYNHDHYISGVAQNVIVRNSEYVTEAAACSGAKCGGVVIYWTDAQTNPVFENNYVHGPGLGTRYGFSSSNNAANTHNVNGIVRRNRFDLPNANTAVEVSACTGCQVTDNLIIVSAGHHGLGTPEQTGQSSPVNSGTIVRNNTVYITGSGSGGVGIDQNAEGNGYVFENNVVYGPSGTTCFNIVNPLASGHPFTVTSYPTTTTNTAGNYCVNNGAAPGVVFVNAAAGDFHPTGPLVGTGNATYYSGTAIGSTLWSATDAGVTRSGAIDIGAYVH